METINNVFRSASAHLETNPQYDHKEIERSLGVAYLQQFERWAHQHIRNSGALNSLDIDTQQKLDALRIAIEALAETLEGIDI